MRWLLYLLAYIPVQLFAYAVTPLLPLFAVVRYGALDNANRFGDGVRLPLWLSWFDTPDNALYGDVNWLVFHPKTTYWDMVGWLYRNSCYGFKWTVLAMPIQDDYGQRSIDGNTNINHHTQTYGSFYIRQRNGAWQYKTVRPMFGKILVLNIGWLLDDISQKRALFMLSPRIK